MSEVTGDVVLTVANLEIALREVAGERDTLLAERKELLEAAESVVKAHRDVIQAVTPGHPNALPSGPMTSKKKEMYQARFSRWHSTTRLLAARIEGSGK